MNKSWQVAVVELDRRDIHGDCQRLRPRCRFATGFTQNPFAQRNDEAALLGNRDKYVRRDHAALRDIASGPMLQNRWFRLTLFSACG